MFRKPALWGGIVGLVGVPSILGGIAIVADNESEHDWGWLLIGAGVLAMVVGGGVYLLLRPHPESPNGRRKARADRGSVSVVGDKNITINMPQLGDIKAAADKVAAATGEGAFTIECRTERGLRLGDDRAALAYLVVTHTGNGKATNAYAKVAEIVEHTSMNTNNQTRPYRQRRYGHQDIFLKWEASETRYHDFHTTANLRVAMGRSGDGGYGLASVEPRGGFRLSLFDSYEVTIEVAADNVPVLRETLLVRMAENTTRDDDGHVTIWLDLPYLVDFRKWVDSDQPEDEQDIDAMRGQ